MTCLSMAGSMTLLCKALKPGYHLGLSTLLISSLSANQSSLIIFPKDSIDQR